MERTRLAKASLAELKNSIRVAKGRKEELKEYLNHLHQAHSQGKISSSQYLETIHKKHDKRNIHEHVHYYDNFIKEHENKIRKHTHSSRSFGFFIIVLILALSLLAYFYLEPTITGFFGQAKIQEKEFAQNLNLNFNSSTTYELQLENQGQLNYVKLDGLIKGPGSVKIYIDNLLILDSSNIKQKTGPPLITGASILNSEELNQDEAPQTSNETSPFLDQDGNLETPGQKPGTGESPASEILNETNETTDLKNKIQNETPETTTPEEKTGEEAIGQEVLKEFSNICEETCDLASLNLNKTSYTLKIEIENAELFLDVVKYSIIETIEEKPKENITNENLTISEEDITTIQEEAILGYPVKWEKTFSVANPGKIKIKLPKEATNILTKEKETPQNTLSPFQEEFPSQKEISFDAEIKDYEISYETPAPLAEEEKIERGKRVKISSPENVHYTNVLASTDLAESLNIKNTARVKILWVEQNTFIVPEKVEDLDANGIYDYIEWIAPSLSNQTFDIIVITKADHLDSNREFISDVYDQVKELDNNWSEEIPNQDYVRVTFEVNLTSDRDITIYPRVTSGSPRIEVYEKDSGSLIAEFTNLIDNKYNKILLTNLQGSQDTFDLKIIGGSVEFDYIVDPSNTYLINADALATATGTTSGTQNAGKNIVRLNNNQLTAMWINAADTDPVCSTSSNSGATWAALASEAGTETGVAVATNGTGVVYTGMFATNGAGDVAYLYNVAGACDTAGTYADVSLTTNDHYRPDVAFDGVHNRYVLCAMDNDDFDVDYAYATPSSTTTLSFTGVDAATVSGDVTSTSCSIDADDNGNVFIASSQDGGVVVYNSSAGTFASSTARTAYSTTSVSNMHMSIRGTTILITAEDINSDLVVVWSTDGINYNSEVLAGTINDPEGCVDVNGNFHIAFVNGSGIDYRRRVSNGTWDGLQTITTTGTELYISVRCTNFPANNRLDSNDLELVYTDTGTNIYFANITVDTAGAADTPPQWYTPSTNNSNPLPGEPVSHNVNWTDNSDLSYAILEVNSSGVNCDTLSNVTINSTFAGLNNWSNMSWVIPNACEGKTIGWRQYANDSINGWNVTSLQTYTVQNVAPNISFGINPIDNNISRFSSLAFDLKMSDNLGVSHLVLYGNWSGSWHANQTNSSPINNSWWNITVSSIPDGKYVWAAWGNDTLGNSAFTIANRTLTIDTVAPTVTLPVYTNATKYSNTQSLTFNISVADSISGPSLCSVNVNGNANQTLAVSSGWCNGTYALTGIADGNKTINAYANDTLGNLALNNSYVVWIDSTAPTITLPVYTNATKYSNTQSMIFNISVVDTGAGPSFCAVNVNGNANQTLAVSGGWCNGTYALTGIADGNKTINAYANDTTGNLALNNSYVVFIDSTAPTITLPVYTNATAKRPSDSLFINVSVTDAGVGLDSSCFINVATATASNVSVAVSSGWCNTSYSLAGSTDGNQTINAYANDTLGNAALNNSYVVTIDNTAPTITLPAYTNATQKQNTDTLTLNISISDSGSGTTGIVCLVDVTGTNQSIAYSDGWCNSTSILLTGLSGGNKTIKVYANDSANNFGLNDSFVVDIISQVAPTISFVETISAKNPTDDTTTSITFNFTATDSNGASNINLSTAQAYFQRTGEQTRSNASCINLSAGVGNNINFTCTIDMWYYDQNGAWTINATIKDNSAAYGENSSTTFIYNLLPGMKMFPASLTWLEVLIGQTNTGSNNDPIQINNTGNAELLNINITSYNLQGEQITTDFILAGNLSVENSSQGCSGTQMQNATSLNITSAILKRGNHSLNYNNETSGQEQLYFCLTNVPQGISQQSYSSTAYGSWEVKILLALIVPRLRKKKKSIKDDKLVKALDLILDELKEEYSLNKKEIAEVMMSKLKEKYNLNKKEMLNTIKSSEETKIPVTIFSKDLGALEALVKYMKENLNMSYSKISELLGRNERTIWTAYSKAKEKQKEALKIKETEIYLPIEIFKDKKLTILESAIVYLKEKGLKFSEISDMLSRDQRNIWTIYTRASKKLNKSV